MTTRSKKATVTENLYAVTYEDEDGQERVVILDGYPLVGDDLVGLRGAARECLEEAGRVSLIRFVRAERVEEFAAPRQRFRR